jgi:Rne/Rng family ribonuclease
MLKGMNKKMFINVEEKEIRIAVTEDSVLQEYYAERTDTQTLVHNIYKGKVSAVVGGIQAAFVDIGLAKNGFLYVADVASVSDEFKDEIEVESYPNKEQRIENVVHKGKPIIVQIVKDPFGTKGARLTAQPTLPGRLVVLMPNAKDVGISRKISDAKERERLKEILKSVRMPEGMGIIVRTAAAGSSKNDIVRDIKYLLSLWARIRTKEVNAPVPSLLYQEQGVIFRVLRDIYSDDFQEILIDSKEQHKDIIKNLGRLLPDLRSKLKFYSDTIHIFERFSIESQIDKIYDRSIHLRSGGSIVIEPTEGLVAIDVNTGRFVGKKSLGETVYLTNLEAAKEIARQVRLRDLGGIIIIDFIDMEVSEHRKAVFKQLQEAFKTDRAKTNILPMSEFCVIEMTRQRIRRSVENVSYKQCSSCKGRGLVKTDVTMAIGILRDIKQFISKHSKKSLEVQAYADIASYMLNEQKGLISSIEKQNSINIFIRPVVGMEREEYKIVGSR